MFLHDADTSRHYLPVPVIKSVIDSMPYSKLVNATFNHIDHYDFDSEMKAHWKNTFHLWLQHMIFVHGFYEYILCLHLPCKFFFTWAVSHKNYLNADLQKIRKFFFCFKINYFYQAT